MKLNVLFIPAMLLFVITPTTWADQSVGAGVQYQTVNDYEEAGVALNLRYAYSLMPELAIQAEVSSTVGYPEQEVFNSSDVSVGFTDFYALGAGLYAAYQYSLGERFFVRGRLGAVYASIEEETCISGDCDTATDSSVELSYGGGGGVVLMPSLNLVAEWTQIGTDVGHGGFTLEYAF